MEVGVGLRLMSDEVLENDFVEFEMKFSGMYLLVPVLYEIKYLLTWNAFFPV